MYHPSSPAGAGSEGQYRLLPDLSAHLLRPVSPVEGCAGSEYRPSDSGAAGRGVALPQASPESCLAGQLAHGLRLSTPPPRLLRLQYQRQHQKWVVDGGRFVIPLYILRTEVRIKDR